ncbi:MAG: lysozyme inhibitor LprI family protein [Bacteroidota bacterium]
MKRILIIALLFCSTSFLFGQTQLELNDAANQKYLKTDKKLNHIYQEILKEYKEDTAFIKNLRISQRIWIQFRDAEMLMKFPERGPSYYGSIQPMCWSEYLTELTEARIKTLQVWIDGIKEGDVCSGSVKQIPIK